MLARRALRSLEGADEDVDAMWAEISTVFSRDLLPHFEIEERYLLVALDQAGAKVLSDAVRAQHARLRELVAAGSRSREHLREFGELLRDHVRFEERRLFPAAEQRLDEHQLAQVARASAALETARRRR
ncbi:MAG: hypothetical protein Kow0062_23500 [Acidobacteriota bacterium]